MTEPLEPFDPGVQALLDRAKEIPAIDPARLDRLHALVAAQVGVPGGGGGGGATGARTLAACAATFVVGVVVGVAGDRASERPLPAPAPSVVYVQVEAPLPPLPSVAVSTPEPALSAPPRVRASADSESSSHGLAAERALLDVARGALARGEPSEALAAVRRHGTEYPKGALVEEREALAVKALVAAGRVDEAKLRAAEFERRFPNGLMLRVVRAAVQNDP